MAEDSRKCALTAAQGADEARAIDIAILDVHQLTAICDYFVICHGRSPVHVRAVADGIETTMDEAAIPQHHREGRGQASWIVLDYFDVVVHIFTEQTRNFYSLGRLWGDAPRLEFAGRAAAESS